MSYAVTVAVSVAPPLRVGRVLATRVVDRLRDARDWTERNAETWRSALEMGEQFCVSWTHDADGVAVLSGEINRNPDTPIIWHGRESLAAMKAVRVRAKKKKTDTKAEDEGGRDVEGRRDDGHEADAEGRVAGSGDGGGGDSAT